MSQHETIATAASGDGLNQDVMNALHALLKPLAQKDRYKVQAEVEALVHDLYCEDLQEMSMAVPGRPAPRLKVGALVRLADDPNPTLCRIVDFQWHEASYAHFTSGWGYTLRDSIYNLKLQGPYFDGAAPWFGARQLDPCYAGGKRRRRAYA